MELDPEARSWRDAERRRREANRAFADQLDPWRMPEAIQERAACIELKKPLPPKHLRTAADHLRAGLRTPRIPTNEAEDQRDALDCLAAEVMKGSLRVVDMFAQCDKDSSGVLDLEEFTSALARINVSAARAQNLFTKLDRSADGLISFQLVAEEVRTKCVELAAAERRLLADGSLSAKLSQQRRAKFHARRRAFEERAIFPQHANRERAAAAFLREEWQHERLVLPRLDLRHASETEHAEHRDDPNLEIRLQPCLRPSSLYSLGGEQRKGHSASPSPPPWRPSAGPAGLTLSSPRVPASIT